MRGEGGAPQLTAGGESIGLTLVGTNVNKISEHEAEMRVDRRKTNSSTLAFPKRSELPSFPLPHPETHYGAGEGEPGEQGSPEKPWPRETEDVRGIWMGWRLGLENILEKDTTLVTELLSLLCMCEERPSRVERVFIFIEFMKI